MSTSPRRISSALATSGNSVCGTPRCCISHAVRLAPCSRGRVSLTQTCSGSPSACARNTGAVAVPQAVAASAPALQWVITLTGPGLRRAMLRSSSSPMQPIAWLIATSSAPIASASRHAASARASVGSGATAARTRSSAQRRLTAVGRVASSAACALASVGVGGVAVERQRESVGADRADQRRAADPHAADGERRRAGVGDADRARRRAAARAGRAPR